MARPVGSPTVITRNMVYQAILDLYDQYPRVAITKGTIALTLGVKPAKIDEHVDRLFELSMVTKPMPGHYEPREAFPDIMISVTSCGRNRLKLDLGETLHEITRRDARNLIQHLWGFAAGYVNPDGTPIPIPLPR